MGVLLILWFLSVLCGLLLWVCYIYRHSVCCKILWADSAALFFYLHPIVVVSSISVYFLHDLFHGAKMILKFVSLRICHVAMSYMLIALMVLKIGIKDIDMIMGIFCLIHMQSWLKDAEYLVMPAIRCLNFLEHMISTSCHSTGEKTISFRTYRR